MLSAHFTLRANAHHPRSEVHVGLFDKKPDFSDIKKDSTTAGSSGSLDGFANRNTANADFSDVESGSSSQSSGTGRTYTVKSGDSLSKIAKQFYGDGNDWKRIHAANRDKVPNPDLIHPGQELIIPDA